jgi:CheY-like chemotaxis protein
MLTDLGLEVHIARSRNEATTFIQSKQRYDFATLDMQLGPDDDFGQEGIYLLDLLKRYQTDTPVVIITRLPYDKRQTAEFFTKGRIKDMLDKPVDQERLRGLVEQHVLRRRRV